MGGASRQVVCRDTRPMLSPRCGPRPGAPATIMTPRRQPRACRPDCGQREPAGARRPAPAGMDQPPLVPLVALDFFFDAPAPEARFFRAGRDAAAFFLLAPPPLPPPRLPGMARIERNRSITSE